MASYITNLEEGERRTFAGHGHAMLASAGGLTLVRGEFEPGWRWSQDVKPIAGTDACMVRHLGYIASGRMGIRLNDASEVEVGPGDLFDVEPGHDAWVIGDQPCISFDFSPDATRYARPAGIAPVDDEAMALVRQGYAAFNAGDLATLQDVMARDVAQHSPGGSQIAGEYKGIEEVLGYYGKLAELTDGTARAHLVDVHGDGHGHVTAIHQFSATRNGVTRVSKGSIVFTVMGGKVTDLLETHGDLAGDDAFFA